MKTQLIVDKNKESKRNYLTLHGLRMIVEKQFGSLNDHELSKDLQLINLYEKADKIVSNKSSGLKREILTCRYYMDE